MTDYIIWDSKKLGPVAINKGDTITIKPKSVMPNLIRKFKVDYIGNDYFVYGVSSHCDGYTVGFWAIDDIVKIAR